MDNFNNAFLPCINLISTFYLPLEAGRSNITSICKQARFARSTETTWDQRGILPCFDFDILFPYVTKYTINCLDKELYIVSVFNWREQLKNITKIIKWWIYIISVIAQGRGDTFAPPGTKTKGAQNVNNIAICIVLDSSIH